MKRTPPRLHWIAACVITALMVSSRAPAAEFSASTVSMVIGFPAGGVYDLYARLVSRYIGAHIPSHPIIIAQDMPGAGGLRAANYIYSIAPHDGTVIGTFTRGLVLSPLLDNAKYDARRFTWIGSVSDDVNVCLSWHAAAVQSWSDLTEKPFRVAGQGSGADPDIYAHLVKNLFHAPIKLVTGYPGSGDISLAMQRGEVDGVCALSWGTVKANFAELLANKQVTVIFQAGLRKARDLPDVPSLLDLAQTPEQRQILAFVFGVQGMARPFMAPPETSQQTALMLRQAFAETVNDPAFLTEAAKLHLEINPATAEQVDAIVGGLYRTPPAIIDAAKHAMTD